MIHKIDVTSDGQKVVIAINDTWYITSIDNMICPVAVQIDSTIIKIRDPEEIRKFLIENRDQLQHIEEIHKYMFYEDLLSNDLTKD